MAYASPDIATPRFLGANVVYQATQALLAGDDSADADVLNDAVLMMDVITSYYTERDALFAAEWKAIQDDRKNPEKAPYGPGEDRGQDDGFRWRELKAMFRSMCRVGKFERMESPAAEWEPLEAKK